MKVEYLIIAICVIFLMQMFFNGAARKREIESLKAKLKSTKRELDGSRNHIQRLDSRIKDLELTPPVSMISRVKESVAKTVSDTAKRRESTPSSSMTSSASNSHYTPSTPHYHDSS